MSVIAAHENCVCGEQKAIGDAQNDDEMKVMNDDTCDDDVKQGNDHVYYAGQSGSNKNDGKEKKNDFVGMMRNKKEKTVRRTKRRKCWSKANCCVPHDPFAPLME